MSGSSEFGRSDGTESEFQPHFATQMKFAASSMLPDPLYCATCGYGQRECVFATPLAGFIPCLNFMATIGPGAAPSSTHRSTAVSILLSCGVLLGPNCPKKVAPDPPPQCCMPGTM